jgi:uncharacterized protein YjaG (DUF416 family)
MTGKEPSTLDEYEHLVRATTGAWSPAQRLAFVAALAERWLGAYDTFSAAEGWGDPDRLRRILGAAWDHLRGRPLSPEDRTRYGEEIQEVTPDTEEFDDLKAWKALTACMILDHALECCVSEDDAVAVKAVRSAFDAVARQGWPSEPAAQPRAWRRAAARDEFTKQRALLEEIGPTLRFDEKSVEALRGRHRPLAPKRSAKRAPKAGKDEGDGLVGDIEHYRVSLARSFAKRTPAHRIVFAAGTAERLLPLYEAFAAATGRGRPELLREVLEAVWRAAKGEPIAPEAIRDYRAQLKNAGPGAAERDPWTAWRVLALALECCGPADDPAPAVIAALHAYLRVAGPDAGVTPKRLEETWNRPDVQVELQKQNFLLMLLGTKAVITGPIADTLRTLYRDVASRDRE